MDEMQRLKTGMTVSDIGNYLIGRVISVGSDAFAVDVQEDGMMWLRPDAIFWVGTHGATLVCRGSRIGHYEL